MADHVTDTRKLYNTFSLTELILSYFEIKTSRCSYLTAKKYFSVYVDIIAKA